MRTTFVLSAILALAPAAARAADRPVVVTRTEDVIYGRKFGMALTLDVFRPQRANGAAVAFLVSGGWYSAHDRIDPTSFAELLKRGYTVFAVVHGSQPKFTVPETAADVNRAIRFIRYHAKDYGIDPHRIGITGGSAGGHLSLLQATAGDKGNPQSPDPVERTSSRIQAVACFFPLTDMLNYGEKGKLVTENVPLRGARFCFDFQELDPKTYLFTRVSDSKNRDILKQISGITHVSAESPPALIIHGDKDEAVPLQQSEEFVARLRKFGVPAELIVRKGEGHGWPDFWQRDMPILADWFDKYLKAPAKR